MLLFYYRVDTVRLCFHLPGVDSVGPVFLLVKCEVIEQEQDKHRDRGPLFLEA